MGIYSYEDRKKFHTAKKRGLDYDEWAPVKSDAPFKALKDWSDHQDRLAAIEALYPKKYPPLHRVVSPKRYYNEPAVTFNTPLEKALGYNYSGQPIYTRSLRPPPRKPLTELFEPNRYTPVSRVTRDPWWWDYPELRPYEPPSGYYKPTKFYLRDSYLSPVKRTYLWGHHPIRPFSAHLY